MLIFVAYGILMAVSGISINQSSSLILRFNQLDSAELYGVLFYCRQRWVNQSVVLDSTESIRTLSWTALSQSEHCPGQHWANQSIVLDSTESIRALSWTALSQSERCSRQHWDNQSIDLDSAESIRALSWTALSQYTKFVYTFAFFVDELFIFS